VDRRTLEEEFSLYLEQQSGRGRIAEAIKGEVCSYGSQIIKRAVSARRREMLDAS